MFRKSPSRKWIIVKMLRSCYIKWHGRHRNHSLFLFCFPLLSDGSEQCNWTPKKLFGFLICHRPPPPPAARVHFPLSFNYHTITKYLWSAYYVSNSMGCQTCCPLCLKYTSHVHLSWMNYSPAFKCLPQPLCEGFPNPLGSQTSLPLYYEHHFTV